MTKLLFFLIGLALNIPLMLMLRASNKANLKTEQRSSQFLMPVFALIYTIVAIFLMNKVTGWMESLIGWLLGLISKIPFVGKVDILRTALNGVQKIAMFIAFYAANLAILAGYVVLKRIITAILKKVCEPNTSLHDFVAGRTFYRREEETGIWYFSERYIQARGLLKAIWISAIVSSVLLSVESLLLFKDDALGAPFAPVFSLLVLGEIFYYIDGKTKKEIKDKFDLNSGMSERIIGYALLREKLKRLFGDKLTADNTDFGNGFGSFSSNEDLFKACEESGDRSLENYALFFRNLLRPDKFVEKLPEEEKKKYQKERFLLDKNYFNSGIDLLKGKSVLFNNPFYYDLIPYAFYAMDRELLKHRKVLVVLGSHGIEDDIALWLRIGLRSVSNIDNMWKIGVLSEESSNVDVGIISRSYVHDASVHEANAAFLNEVEYIVVVEPSKLITTAQIGLNALVRRCKKYKGRLVCCAMDKNCDGLVDALSHAVMTNITEVTATNHYNGISSYMCWVADKTMLQHRMLPNIARYLGMGTELSFAALKEQVGQTKWFGGDAFPVSDMNWIAKQYYYELLRNANLPTNQDYMEECFKTTPNMWNEKIVDHCYLTVEDADFNMFEIKREFASRARTESFINVISSEYLLREYMSRNFGIFDADSKAVPYIVADFARTKRNVILRICMQLCSEFISLESIREEMDIIDIRDDDIIPSLWNEICEIFSPIGEEKRDETGGRVLSIRCEGTDKSKDFSADIIKYRKKYNIALGKTEEQYRIDDEEVCRFITDQMQNAKYVDEYEEVANKYIGSELLGHIYQKYLPGQFFTFGGKYYEMVSVASGNRIVVRRAADHIDGRPFYRQARQYTLKKTVDEERIGSTRDIGGLKITRQFADIEVKTSGYWKLFPANDFANGKYVKVENIPDRSFNNKQILKIDFTEYADSFTDDIRKTITAMLNELFTTYFADNRHYICALTSGSIDIPLTYSLDGGDEKSVYIIEDSQMDIGLLVAVERNIERFMEMICEYLQWHFEEYEKSINPPEEPEPPAFGVDDDTDDDNKKGGKIRKFFGKIGIFFKRMGRGIKNFFKKIFGKKKKPEVIKPEEPEEPEKPEVPEGVEGTEGTGETGEPETPGKTGETEEPKEPEKPDAPEELEGTEGKGAKRFFKKLFGKKKKPEVIKPKEPEEPKEPEKPDIPEGIEGTGEVVESEVPGKAEGNEEAEDQPTGSADDVESDQGETAEKENAEDDI